MRFRLGKVVGGAAATAALVGLPLIAWAGPADASSNYCGYGSSNGNIQTCLSMGGGGANASAQVKDSARILDLCLTKNGSNVSCTGWTYVKPGAGIGISDVPAGGYGYCAVTTKSQPDGSKVQVDKECQPTSGSGTTSVG